MPTSRRQFLLGTGAATGLALWPRARAWSSTGAADVIVIGASLAGLNAALILEEQGLSVIVLEAADYVGGRTRTFDLPVGPTNAGGQSVGPFYGRLRDLISRLKVAIVPVPEGPPPKTGLHINGVLTSSAGWAQSKANRTVRCARLALQSVDTL